LLLKKYKLELNVKLPEACTDDGKSSQSDSKKRELSDSPCLHWKLFTDIGISIMMRILSMFYAIC